MAERGEFELPVPISEQSDYKKMSGFAAPRRIIGIGRGSTGRRGRSASRSEAINWYRQFEFNSLQQAVWLRAAFFRRHASNAAHLRAFKISKSGPGKVE